MCIHLPSLRHSSLSSTLSQTQLTHAQLDQALSYKCLLERTQAVHPRSITSKPSARSCVPSLRRLCNFRRESRLYHPPRMFQLRPSGLKPGTLHVLKAWNNEIVEIQHKISLSGSLKTLDLHQSRMTLLPDTSADLTA
ncbi:hypothetical protein DFH29DRAFT_272738 [Suillus ampliporus]|nr:hypothetical protein DFH29DRAFT_272738 [Suillus ampliporus]